MSAHTSPASPSPVQPVAAFERWLLLAVFAAAALAHAYFGTRNLAYGFLPGHEFRQSQTALITRVIDEQDNFSLRYETPIFGKPWVSNPLEFPLYEWTVVGLSRATGCTHIVAARSLSLTCFYLTLPALYLLLGRLGLAPPRRLFVLALVLVCPVYIFYSRAFLIESMELMASAWFLFAFVRTLDTRRWPWLALALSAGTVAALVKNTTFAVWLLPAFALALWHLAADLRARRGFPALLRTGLWALAAVSVPLLALGWWLAFTDAIKAAHPAAAIFTAKNLSQGNFGLLDVSARFSADTWATLGDRWREAIVSPWLIGALTALGLALRGPHRRPLLGLAAVFLGAQLLFPFAYALQEYYFYACAVFLLAALGYAMFGLLDTPVPLPRWCRFAFLLVPCAGLFLNYWHGYRPQQLIPSPGGTGLTEALRAYTPPDSVLVISGADWSAAIPYFSHRRALMIRNGMERDDAYLDRAFAALADEDVAALVLVGAQRGNQALADRAADRFGFDRTPTFSHPQGDVYLHRLYRKSILLRLLSTDHYDQVSTRYTEPELYPPAPEPVNLAPATARTAFPMILPAPERVRLAYDYTTWPRDARPPRLSVHPASELWIRPPVGATRVEAEFGILPGAYERDGDRTNGIEFVLYAEAPDGTRRELHHQRLDPADRPADRGSQQWRLPVALHAGERLVFATFPYGSVAFDWGYLDRLIVK